MGRPPIGKTRMTSTERSRRRRARLRAANPPPVSPASNRCAWCGRTDCILVGENAVMICERCIEEAAIAIRETRAAKKRAALRQAQFASEE